MSFDGYRARKRDQRTTVLPSSLPLPALISDFIHRSPPFRHLLFPPSILEQTCRESHYHLFLAFLRTRTQRLANTSPSSLPQAAALAALIAVVTGPTGSSYFDPTGTRGRSSSGVKIEREGEGERKGDEAGGQLSSSRSLDHPPPQRAAHLPFLLSRAPVGSQEERNVPKDGKRKTR